MTAALAPATAHAAPPSNDNFIGALSLPLGGAVQGNNIDATHETNEPVPGAGQVKQDDCQTVNSGPSCTTSVWYRFDPASSGDYTIETCDLGTNVDTVLAVYTGTTLGSLSPVAGAANDDACAGGPSDNGSRVHFTATGGVTYWVEVAGYAADQGTFWLRAYAGSSPKAPPIPDTVLLRDHSLAAAKNEGGYELDGPRHSASFAFTSDTVGASFECSLDGAAFTVCHSPVSFDGLTGTHTFTVRSVSSGVADPTPASAIFHVDGTPPDTFFLSIPPDPTSNPAVEIDPRSTERSFFDTFVCGLDAQQPLPSCDGGNSFSNLCNGVHTFTAAAVDYADNVDPTPVTTSFHETGGSESCAGPNLTVGPPTSSTPTDEDFSISVNPHGDGGMLVLDYGTTPSYGFSKTLPVKPSNTSKDTSIDFLSPGTLYHYRVTLTTSAGTVTTGDATFTTASAGTTVPTASLGTAVAVGTHGVVIPVTADPGTGTGFVAVLLDNGPIQPDQAPEFSSLQQVTSGGPTTASVDVVDLDPGTYHARAVVFQDNAPFMDAMSPEMTFTIAAPGGPPVVTPPALPPVPAFKLRAGFIKVLKIHHGSKTITLVISHLPPSSAVNVTVNATVRSSAVKRLAKGHAKANKAGVAKVKIKLSRKARKVLRSKRTKSLAFKVHVKPPSQAATSLTLHRKVTR